jgi:VWFA-related protein
MLRTAVLLASLAAVGAVQDAQQPPTFKSGVQLVEVDVRVFDKDGRFVADLTRDDFELVENGAAQNIEAMYLVGAAVPVAAASDPAGALSGRTGAPAPGPAAPHTWIFLFDLSHLTPGAGFDRARKAVEDFLRDGFREGDIGGIVAGDKMVNNRLTSVRQELLDSVTQVKPRGDARTRMMELTREWPRLLNEEEAIRVGRGEREPLQRAITRACGDDPEQCPIADSAVREKGQKLGAALHRASMETLVALNALASGLSRVPGPKTVVFLSDGFVAQDVETTVRSVVGQVGRAGARVYAIDVRGLNRFGGAGMIDQERVDDPAGPGTNFDGVADGPNSLAIDTGGMMIRNENNIGRALGRIAEDAGRYYVLAYQPANSNFDGKYRPIQVRVKRDGLRVRARRGYLALPAARMLIPQPIKPPRVDEPAPAVTEREPATPIAPPLEPVAALPSPATGTIVAETTPETTVTTGGAVRLRPDTAGRIKALSSGETAATTALAQEGWKAYERGDVEAAEAAFSKAAARPDVRPWVLYALGMSQAGLGRAAEAIAWWERVRQAVPDFAPVYMDLADTYAQVSDLTRALAVMRDAEKRWPDSPEIHSAIGVIHVRRGALDDGIRALVKATQLAPDDGLAHLNLGRAYALRFHRGRRYVTSQRRWVAPEGDRTKALEAFRKCVQLGGPYARPANEELTLLEWSK